MKVTVLGSGTSQGVPVIACKCNICTSCNPKDKRLRSSILIKWKSFNFVVDCGPDFRYQMLRANYNKLDGVFFTHEHSDHVSGIDDLRPFYFNHGDIDIYAHNRVLLNLKSRYNYIFNNNNNYPGVPVINPIEIDNNVFNVKGLNITPICVKHNKLQVFGFRLEDFAYITDMKTISDFEISKLTNLKVLVLNCLRIKEHHSHLNLKEALDLVKIIKPKICYFTHISHYLGFHKEVESNLPDNIFLAYDQLTIKIS